MQTAYPNRSLKAWNTIALTALVLTLGSPAFGIPRASEEGPQMPKLEEDWLTLTPSEAIRHLLEGKTPPPSSPKEAALEFEYLIRPFGESAKARDFMLLQTALLKENPSENTKARLLSLLLAPAGDNLQEALIDYLSDVELESLKDGDDDRLPTREEEIAEAAALGLVLAKRGPALGKITIADLKAGREDKAVFLFHILGLSAMRTQDPEAEKAVEQTVQDILAEPETAQTELGKYLRENTKEQ
jgi:hypothetical protein